MVYNKRTTHLNCHGLKTNKTTRAYEKQTPAYNSLHYLKVFISNLQSPTPKQNSVANPIRLLGGGDESSSSSTGVWGTNALSSPEFKLAGTSMEHDGKRHLPDCSVRRSVLLALNC